MFLHTATIGMNFWASFILFLSFSECDDALRQGCSQPLGLESKAIRDDQLDAKSYDNGWEPRKGRLGNDRAWCSDIEDPGVEYFEIDLKRVRHVSAIATQGVKYVFKEYYVKTYALEYSYDGTQWYQYKQNIAGTYKEKIFTGNKNTNLVNTNELSDEFVTRFLRIYPLKFKNDMCLRVELYGCIDSEDDCSKFIGQANGGKEITSPQYPKPYPAGTDCTWIISSSSWQRIALLFQHFDVGSKAGESQSCGGDFLKVLDGPHHWSTALGTYCNGVHPTVVKSTNEVLRIRFHSEGNSSPRKGFQLQLLRFTSGIDEVFSGTACEGAKLSLDCTKFSKTIQILYTFFGAYPYARDCGANYTNTTCQASGVKEKVVYYCQDYRQCSVPVIQSYFSHVCPSGVKQSLEIYYQCTSTTLKTVSPTPRPTTAPALSSPPPDALTPLLPATFAPPPTLPLTNQPTSSSATTVPSLVEVTVAEMTTQPTTPEETKVPPVGGEKEARTSDGLSSGSLAAVVVFAALVLIGVLLAVVYVVYKRRHRGKRTPRVPSVKYSNPDDSERASHANKRCYTDPGEENYESVNILYESANDEKTNHQRAEDHIYESPSTVSTGPSITDNPLYVRTGPEDDGYEIVRPSRPPAAVPSHEYEKPMKSKSKAASITNPNYDKTLTIQSVPEDM